MPPSIIDKIDESTNLVLKKIEDSENNIVNRTSNLNVASEYGKIMDKYDSAAGNHREAIKTALNEKNNESKTVEIAYSFGDLGEWANKNIVTKRRGKNSPHSRLLHHRPREPLQSLQNGIQGSTRQRLTIYERSS